MSDGPWHEDPTFRGTLEGLLFPPEKLDAAADELDALLSLADVGGGRMLDVPCGVGRHAVELADRGFEVTGVDATGRYLETARRRAEEAGVDPELVGADMREFRRPEAFDLVLNVYTSFGYFEDRDDDRLTARNFHESLAEGGRLVMSLTCWRNTRSGTTGVGWRTAGSSSRTTKPASSPCPTGSTPPTNCRHCSSRSASNQSRPTATGRARPPTKTPSGWWSSRNASRL